MRLSRRYNLLAPLLLFGFPALAQVAPPSSEVLQVESKLVVLDATVLDKAGHVIAQPLTRDDFLITEDKIPQKLYSFESTSDHVMRGVAGEEDKSSLLIFVLDELNYAYRPAESSSWNVAEDLNEQVYERRELAAFLREQPASLVQRTEVLALTHHGFHVLIEPTHDRDAVLKRVREHDPGLSSPFRDYLEEVGSNAGSPADYTLSVKSLQAIWALALQQRSEPGKKHVVWLGYGGANRLAARRVSSQQLTPLERHVRQITDLLVEARVTLDVFGPGIGPSIGGGWSESMLSAVEQTSRYAFESDFGFSGFIHDTGGLWQNGNDVRGEIQESVNYGTLYYTLSYRPLNQDFDGDFRRIHVSVKGHPDWVVLTKAGYFAMRFGGAEDAEHQTMTDLSVASLETMPFAAIDPTLEQVERVKGTDLVRFTFRLEESDLAWRTDVESSKREADLAVSAVALGPVVTSKVLSSQVATWKLRTPANAAVKVRSSISLKVSVPPKTERLRFVVRDLSNGHTGTVDLKAAALAAAPEIDEVPSTLKLRSSAP